jgi:hypothetical protein
MPTSSSRDLAARQHADAALAAARRPRQIMSDWPELMQLAPPSAALATGRQDCRFAEARPPEPARLCGLDVQGRPRRRRSEGHRGPSVFVLDSLTETAMHEVGHALGLPTTSGPSRGLGGASRLPTAAVHGGETASPARIMEYTPVNPAVFPDATAGAPFPDHAPDPYDLWANRIRLPGGPYFRPRWRRPRSRPRLARIRGRSRRARKQARLPSTRTRMPASDSIA